MAVPASAATSVSWLWTRLFHPDHSDDVGSGLALSQKGSRNYSVVLTPAQTQDVVARSRTGARLWVRHLRSTGVGPQEVVADPKSDRIYVGGYFDRAGDRGPHHGLLVTAFVGSTGRLVWRGRIAGHWDGEYRLSNAAIGVAPNGRRVFVTGSLQRRLPTGSRMLVGMAGAFRASDGRRLWHVPYRADDYGETQTVAIATGPHRVFAASRRVDGTGDADWLTIGFDASSGRRLWFDRIRGGTNADGGGIAAPYAAATNPATGTLYVTGFEDFPNLTPFTTVAFDPDTGRQLWTGTDNVEGIARAIAVSRGGGRVYVAGLRVVQSNHRFGVVAYKASTGRRKWTHTYMGNGPNGDAGLAVGVSPDGTRVYASGVSADAKPLDALATLALRARNGNVVWKSISKGPGGLWSTMVADLQVAPDGRLYVESSRARAPRDGDPREEGVTFSFHR
jgi:DNA-binding beta-propeller fold protein YncE